MVDDGSENPPAAEVRMFEEQLAIRLIEMSPNAGPASARNAGAAQAQGTYLVFIDDDCIPDPGWLQSLDDRLRAAPAALVGGTILNGAPTSLCAEASQQLVDFLYRYYNSDIDNARWFMSANIACPRKEFLSIGGFGTDFPLAAAEDRDFCDRWHEAGLRVVMAPDAKVLHVRPMTLATFWRQHRTYGRGAHHLHQARGRRNVALPTMEPLSFYFRLLSTPFTSRKGMLAPVLLLLLIVSQLGYAFGYYPERRRSPLGSSPDGRRARRPASGEGARSEAVVPTVATAVGENGSAA